MARPSAPPGSQASLREANRQRIVDALTAHGSLAQIELADITGLSPATVSNIVRELAAADIISTTFGSRSGRRAVQVSLTRQVGLVAALHFSSRSLDIVIADSALTTVAERHVPLAADHRYDRELDRAVLLVGDMLDGVGAVLGELLAATLSVPVPVDPHTGRLAVPGLMPGWDGVDLATSLRTRLDVPIVVEHGATLGALAEARTGAAVGARVSVYVCVGHSIGSGIVIDGVPFRGPRGRAGQIGHVTLDENGAICRCGNRGCLETVAGGKALLELFAGIPGITRLSDLIAEAESGGAGARRAIADAGKHIGVAVASVANLLDPDVVVVGGELARTGETLLAPVRHAVERSALDGARELQIVASGLEGRAELTGALLVALQTADATAAGRILSAG
jgi:predicted NBD/HSP70 family sugar kinase